MGKKKHKLMVTNLVHTARVRNTDNVYHDLTKIKDILTFLIDLKQVVKYGHNLPYRKMFYRQLP